MPWRVGLDPPMVEAIQLVAGDMDIDGGAIVGVARGGQAIVRARHVAAYLCAVTLEYSARAIAPRFRRHRSTIDDALRRIEDGRDDPEFDERVSRLEMRLQRLTYISTQAPETAGHSAVLAR